MDFKVKPIKSFLLFIESPVSDDPNIHGLKQLLEIQRFLEEFKSLLMIPLLLLKERRDTLYSA